MGGEGGGKWTERLHKSITSEAISINSGESKEKKPKTGYAIHTVAPPDAVHGRGRRGQVDGEAAVVLGDTGEPLGPHWQTPLMGVEGEAKRTER